MTYAFEAVGLTKRFGDTLALDGVDLAARPGTVLGVLGPNGAGKTTAVRILATLLRADAGTARVSGFDVARQPHLVRGTIGLTGQYGGQRVRGFAGRYADTLGSPSSQNRQGRSAPLRRPTRGPVRIRASAAGRSGAVRVSGPLRRSTPLCRRSMPSASHSRAGPRARSRSRLPRRSRARSTPATTSPARSSSAEGRPGSPQTTLQQ